MRHLLNDFRTSLRSLWRSPGSTTISVVILALAIGGTATLWQALDATVLRPLPFFEARRLVRIFDVHDGVTWTVSPPNFMDYRDQAKSLSSTAAWSEGSFALSGPEGSAEQVPGSEVTADFFSTLRVEARLGRALGAADARQPVVLLSDELWRRRYAADPDIVGTTIRVDGAEREVIGVLPPGRDFPADSRLWTPLDFADDVYTTQRGAHWLQVVARLRDGVELDQANAELGTISARLAAADPSHNEKLVARGYGIVEWMVRRSRATLLLLLGAVGIALLAACANLACLSLARTVARGHELALRSSLGAGSSRLARALVLDNLLLAAVGAALGGLFARLAVDRLPLLLGDLPRLAEIRFDHAGAISLAALAGFAGLLVGIAPASFTLRREPVEILRSGGRSLTGSRSAGRIRRLLVVATAALALLLVAGAALVVRSYSRLAAVDPGFDPTDRLAFSLSMPSADYPTPESVAQLVDRLDTRLGALPDVEQVGTTFGQLFGQFGYRISVERLDERDLPDDDSRESPQIRFVSPGFFAALGMRPVAGRGIDAGDRYGSTNVVVANESGARLVFGDTDPLGHTVELGTRRGARGRVRGQVVGVVGDVREQQLDDQPRPTLYFSLDQFPADFLTVVLRSAPGRLERLTPAVREVVSQLDPNLPIFKLRTLDQLLADSLATQRSLARLMSAFALFSVLLAALGVFGILSQAVTEQRRELAVRSALGATPGSLALLVLRQASLLAALGLAAGFAALVPLSRFLRSSLYELSPTDPPTLAGAGLLLLAVALVSGWLPARQALRLDPITALRQE